MLESGLYTYLVSANTSAGDRIYPKRLPQGVALPAVVYLKISAGIDYTQSGESHLRTPRYQFECWGADALTAKNLAEQVIQVCSGYAGLMGDQTVQAGFIEGERDDDDPETDRDRVSLDIIFHHRRS
jgi:hypothetical protein